MNKHFRQYCFNPKSISAGGEIPAFDFHIHTLYADGKASVADVCRIAVEKGLQAIAFTEHAESWHHNTPDWFESYSADIDVARQKFSGKLQIFKSIETPATDFEGNLFLDGIQPEKLDFVLGAAHRYPGLDGRKVSSLLADEAIELEYKTILGLIESGNIDIIAHIGATCSKYVTTFPDSLTRELLAKAAKNDVVVEINPVYHKPIKNFIQMCSKHGVIVSLGSNAHGFGDIGLVREILKKEYQS
jgi:HisJ family histidinol phosphate phosphatase